MDNIQSSRVRCLILFTVGYQLQHSIFFIRWMLGKKKRRETGRTMKTERKKIQKQNANGNYKINGRTD